MKWNNAFVFDKEDEQFHVYEVFVDKRGNMRTENSKLTITGYSVDDVILGLKLMIADLEKNLVFNSIEELDQHYNIGE